MWKKLLSSVFASLLLFSAIPGAQATAPLPPQHFMAVAGNETAYLHWAHSPSENLLGYILSMSIDGGETFTEGQSILAPEGGRLNNFFTVTDLSNDVSHIFKLVSYNPSIEKSEEVISNTVVPVDGANNDYTAPDEITNLKITPGDESLALEWSASANTSGDLIGYNIQKAVDGEIVDDRFIGNNTDYTFIELENGVIHTFKVMTKDAFGNFSEGVSISGTPVAPPETTNIVIEEGVFSIPTFPDVTGGTFRKYIEYLEAKGIISGYSDGTFRPDNSLTRGEAVTLLLKASDLEIDDNITVQSFFDIDEDHGLGVYIENAYSYSIIDGYEDGSFRPDQTINRGEFIKIFVEILSAKLRTVSEEFAQFTDVAHDDTFAPWIYAAFKDEITVGYADKTFRPKKQIKRSEAAAMLARFFQKDTNPVIENSIEELQVLSMINETRSAANLEPYAVRSDLSSAARGHAEDIALNKGDLSSIGSDESTPAQRVDRVGVQYLSVSENVMAASFESRSITDALSAIHEAIMAQPDNEENQKSNLFSTFKNFSDIGIGVYVHEEDMKVYVIVDFVELDS